MTLVDTAAAPSFPVWNPAEAAGAGATFAGVLGALVIAVTFQIAAGIEGQKPGGSQRSRSASLLAAPISLLMLLAAGYMYVVLSGTNTHSQEILRECGMSSGTCDLAYLRISAAMFALGGSFLGAGAIALTFTLMLVTRENPQVANSKYAVDVLLGATLIISSLALTWGYRDAQWVFDSKKMAIPTFLFGTDRLPWLVGGITAGFVGAIVLSSYLPHHDDKRTESLLVRFWKTCLLSAQFVRLPLIRLFRIEGVESLAC